MLGMEFIELTRWGDALTDEIREQERTGSQGILTKKYSVREDGAEVAYVALDWYALEDCTDLILYGMFVPEVLRHQGIGSRILAEAEKLAKAHGYSRVLLIAHPLEDYPPESLSAWYRRHGFKSATNHGVADGMVKDVL
jgi:GNAT superfamily N-acetyltransferase